MLKCIRYATLLLVAIISLVLRWFIVVQSQIVRWAMADVSWLKRSPPLFLWRGSRLEHIIMVACIQPLCGQVVRNGTCRPQCQYQREWYLLYRWSPLQIYSNQDSFYSQKTGACKSSVSNLFRHVSFGVKPMYMVFRMTVGLLATLPNLVCSD